jgi:hypothetical protein
MIQEKTKKNRLLRAIRDGVINAQKCYNEAASSPLCWAPEYFIDVHVFQSLFSNFGKDSVTLQHNINDLKENYSLKMPRGRTLRGLPNDARIDMIFWEPKIGKILAFIEVKRDANNFEVDIKRICRLTMKNGDFGIFISTIHQEYDNTKNNKLNRGKAENKLNPDLKEHGKQINKIINMHYENKFKKVELYPKKYLPNPIWTELEPGKNKYWVWRPVIFVIERKRKQV